MSDEIYQRLRNDDCCRTLLRDIIESFGYKKASFNKTFYVEDVLKRRFHGKPRSETREKIYSAFNFYNEYGLVKMTDGSIEINKTNVRKYIR